MLTFPNNRPLVIGMVHLRALPGSPRFGGSLREVLDAARYDTAALAAGGVDAIMVENFHDAPFFPAAVPPHTVAAITAAAIAVRDEAPLPFGINVLRNDGRAALAVAAAVGAAFIRVNVLCGARLADQGILQGMAHELMRDRVLLAADAIKVLADVDVKHSAPLAVRPLEDEVEDTVERGMADAVIVSGAATAKATDLEKVRQAKRCCRGRPVLVGSGVTGETARSFAGVADGLIVGSWLKRDGVVANPVDVRRVKELMAAL
ncbi:MAG: BtpA/SgcQ family protein [Tepidisphaerales bacterium]